MKEQFKLVLASSAMVCTQEPHFLTILQYLSMKMLFSPVKGRKEVGALASKGGKNDKS